MGSRAHTKEIDRNFTVMKGNFTENLEKGGGVPSHPSHSSS